MSRARIAVAVLLLAAVGVAAWLLKPRPLFQPETPRERTIASVMMSDLTGLRNAEADYFRRRGRFTDIADSTIFLRTPGVGAPLIKLDGEGWYASVRHSLLPGVVCAIAVATSNPLRRSAPDGEAICGRA